MKCEVIFDDRRGPEDLGIDTTPVGLLIESDSLAGADNTVAIVQKLEVVAPKPNRAGSTTMLPKNPSLAALIIMTIILIMLVSFLVHTRRRIRSRNNSNKNSSSSSSSRHMKAVTALASLLLFSMTYFVLEFPAAAWSDLNEMEPVNQRIATAVTSESFPLEKALNHFELGLAMHRDICWNGKDESALVASENFTFASTSWPLIIEYPKRPPDPTFDPSRLKFLALYFPQWYPAPENKMFDDWRYFQNPNLTHNHNHVPLFRPLNNMYYDSRCHGIRKTQAALAKKFLLDGFVYYFYYFNNTMMLPEVNERMLVDGEPDTDFAFMWINSEPFGGFDPDYNLENLDNFVDTLAKYFSHSRYIHVNNRPVLYLYHGPKIPGVYMQELFVRLSAKGFLRPYIVTSIQHYGGNWLAWNFADSYAEFPPNLYQLWKSYGYTKYHHTSNYHLGLNLNFDNTPRLSNGNPDLLPEILTKHRHVPVVEANPSEFLERCIARVNAWSKHQTMEKVVLIFAWNEWSEQAALEPSDRFHYKYLEALRDCKLATSTYRSISPE